MQSNIYLGIDHNGHVHMTCGHVAQSVLVGYQLLLFVICDLLADFYPELQKNYYSNEKIQVLNDCKEINFGCTIFSEISNRKNSPFPRKISVRSLIF